MTCPRCHAENPSGMKFCGQCAAPLAATCASCGASNPPENKFCGQCAAPLGKVAEPRLQSPDAYTPKHLAERILTSKAALEGERKQVTVLFADLKGSMELLADRDPEEARKILDPVLQLMMDAVHRYEGTVNQVMGDGIMALFGAPLAHEDHAVRACYAALRMQEGVRRYSDELRRAQGMEVQIRVGVNSGDVVVRSIGSDLRMDYSFGTSVIPSAVSGAWLAYVLSQLGRFDEAIGHAEAAVRIAEAADHPWTLHFGLSNLGRAHLRRGDLPRATRVLERVLEVCRTWQIVAGTPPVAATLGAAYALAGRADEVLPLVAGAVEEFRSRPRHTWPALILLCAGMTYLSAGRIDEAAGHAREALALTRRLGARGRDADALCLAGDVASTSGAGEAEGYYREALALADTLGMRPLVAHCHLGLGKLYRRTGQSNLPREHLTTATTMYREMGMTYWLDRAERETTVPG